MSSEITHVIFDLDGTLIAESARLEAQARAVAWKFGESIEDMQRVVDSFFSVNDKAQALKESGHPEYKGNIPWYMREMGEILGVSVKKEESETMATAWSEAYENSHDEPVLFPDVVECLETLKSKNISLIIASGNTVATREQLLAGAGIREYFTDIYAATDVGFQKQDIRFWEKVLDEIGVKPEQIAVVGNQINDDIMHPKTLGMITIFVDRPGVLRKNLGPKEVVADYTIADTRKIPELIEHK